MKHTKHTKGRLEMKAFAIKVCYLAICLGIVWGAVLVYKWRFERFSKLRKIFRLYREKECPDCLGSGGVFGEGGVLIDICERCDSYSWVRQIPNHKYKWWMGKMKAEITEDVYDELKEKYQ